MNKKTVRLRKIKEYMREYDREVTITEIFETVFKANNSNITRKTIQRDMEELIEKKEIIQREGCPLKFSLIGNKTYQIELTAEEIDEILKALEDQPLIQNKIFLQMMKE